VPTLEVEQAEARGYLGIDRNARVLLMFGKIRRYKGVDIALEALKHLPQMAEPVVLLVVGGGDDNNEAYLKQLNEYVRKENLVSNVTFYTEFVPDKDIELFFRAADLLLLPYREGDFQSGVLFLAYRFGLPVIVSDVGSLPEDVEKDVTGLVFRSEDPMDLAVKIAQFYRGLHLLPGLRKRLYAYVTEKYQWNQLSRATIEAYQFAQRHGKRFRQSRDTGGVTLHDKTVTKNSAGSSNVEETNR
jgi:glycosyltransferase involved in cell wall biosynthesis